MRIELIEKLIEGMDFTLFREFARQCILQRGYKAVPTDGWSDGGRDIKVYSLDGRISKQLAFQTSVEWGWDSKLWDDLTKAKEKLGCTDFTYVTNRRIGDAVFEPMVQRALTDEGIHLNKIDKQDLAAQIVDLEQEPWFTSFLQLPAASSDTATSSLQREVADAFVLFSDDADDFRDRIAEHALMVALLHQGKLSREAAAAQASKILDYADDNRFNSALDRLQQSGEIVFENNRFFLSSDKAAQYAATQAIVAADRESYRKALQECLSGYLSGSKADIDAAVSGVEQILGTLVRRYADYQVALLQDSEQANDVRKTYIEQVLALESTMHQLGVPLNSVKECIELINAVAQQHPVVTRLVAGDVFRRLVPCERSALLNALGRVTGVRIFLEPTVIIPLLCSKLYRNAAGNRHLRAAQWLFDRSASLHVKFSVPDIYLEECSVHLINAARYINLFPKVDTAELAYSENAFVAFYAALRLQDKPVPTFKAFLEQFGYSATGDFKEKQARVQAKLRRLLRAYNIDVAEIRHYRTDNLIRRVAEQDLLHIYNEAGVRKPSVLERHDTQMLAVIRDMAFKGGDALLLTTWDSTLQSACRLDEYDWWCIDPLHAGDLLSLVQPGGHGAMGVDVALLLDDTHLQQAAQIWDTIVRIEKDRMFDAELIDSAVKYKNEFLGRAIADPVAKSWKEWRQATGIEQGEESDESDEADIGVATDG